jgi:HSP20 family molecular chaperone IbpA
VEVAVAKNGIELRKADTILEDLDRLQRQISERAYELFRHRDGQWGDALTDWLTAEHELVWKPAVELRQKDGQFEVLAALPGISAKDVDVQVTPDAVLIQAETHHQHAEGAGTVHTCELNAGKAFRSVRFPAPIDPNSVKASYHDGLLQLKASIASQPAPQV